MSETPDPTRSKVGRLIETYEMNDVGQELEDRWTGTGYESQSLRSLADWFNERLLAMKLERAGENPIDGEVANLYRLLTEDDVTAGMRVDAEATLERNGIDPDELRTEFVSHQAVYTYLTEFRGASKERSPGDRLQSVRTTVQRLQSRLIAVVENNLDQLRTTERLVLGSFNVLVDIQVLCEDCGASYPITDLLDRGGCDCQSDSDTIE
ncbi:rod-determining factor RdfA [Halobellus captivus]|uniref:rod-determining factor RdfA n=1 Tax=Halobellus captivus TaxID=2592614 RepID=UPI0011A4661D|nr:rod-determining factor RdfA [Halobellus captivus]